MVGQPGSPYEAWVERVRAWAGDESVSLEGLPQLSVESMPMASYERLIVHLNAATEAVTQKWVDELSVLLSDLPEPQEVARRLVDLRRKLARRLELARHPGLPEELRKPYSDSAEKDIRRYQQDVEESVSKLRRILPTPVAEHYLRVVRENSFVAVLGYSSSQAGGRMTATHQPGPTSQPGRPEGRRPRRIVFD